MYKIVALSVAVALLIGSMPPRVQALAPFKKAFQEKYVDGSSSEEFKEAFKKASCNTCHLKGKKKEERNAYGEELAKLIEGDANQRIKQAGEIDDATKKAETDKVLAELEQAFEKVAKMEAAAGETYGDRIQAGKLPLEQ
jgi:hypothetical protein